MNINDKMPPSLTKEYLMELINNYQNQLTDDAVDYLHLRGIDQQTIEKFKIGYEKDMIGFQVYGKDFKGYFRNRIIFPLLTITNEIVDLIGRSIDEKEPKFKTLIGIDDVFFNESIINNNEDIILCNSIFDVLSLDQVHLPAVCMVNNQLKENQVEKLKAKRVFLCFGNDEIGRRETIRVAKMIEQKASELYIIHLPEGFKDVNDFFIKVKQPVEAFMNIINQTLKESLLSPIAPDSSYLIHFQEEFIKRYKGLLSGIQTGFKGLDDLLVGGLQEGLYLLGGNVSVGKTYLLRQIADLIAENVPVIFVSWDMTSFELWTRSMARFTGYSSQEIITGQVPVEVIQNANQKYMKIANNIWTIEANPHMTLEDIIIFIGKISQSLQKKPVIIFDHLQRINLKQKTNLQPEDLKLQITYFLQSLSRQWSTAILLASTSNGKSLSCDLLAAVDVFISMERVNEKEEQPIVILDVKKNRNGSLGKIKLNFDRINGKFSEISENRD